MLQADTREDGDNDPGFIDRLKAMYHKVIRAEAAVTDVIMEGPRHSHLRLVLSTNTRFARQEVAEAIRDLLNARLIVTDQVPQAGDSPALERKAYGEPLKKFVGPQHERAPVVSQALKPKALPIAGKVLTPRGRVALERLSSDLDLNFPKDRTIFCGRVEQSAGDPKLKLAARRLAILYLNERAKALALQQARQPRT